MIVQSRSLHSMLRTLVTLTHWQLAGCAPAGAGQVRKRSSPKLSTYRASAQVPRRAGHAGVETNEAGYSTIASSCGYGAV